MHRRSGGEALDHGGRVAVVQAALPRPLVLAELSAAWALGATVACADDAVVVVAVPPTPDPRPRDGLVVRRCALRRDEVVRTSLGWATNPARTACDLLLTLSRDRAVPAVDAVLHVSGATVPEVASALATRRGARGVTRARLWLPLADGRAESVRESELRLLLADAGLPVPVPQHVVRDGEGAFVARLDLAWPDAKVAVEYDGAHHRARDQHSRDLARHNRLRALGWVVLQVDAGVFARPVELLHHLRGLLG